MATEDEEFEFRLRAEREAAMRPAGAPAPAALPPAAPPRREVGFVESAGRTAAASTIPVVKMFGLAAATAARLFGQKAQDKVFAAMDRVTGRMEQEYRPQAGEEFSTAGQIAGGIASMPVEVAGGFGLQHGVERAQEVVQRGGSVGEAGRAGAVTGGVRVALNALPVKVGGAVGRVVENAAGRVIGGGLTGAGLVGVTGTAGRAAENAVLPEGEQFSDLRQNVAPSVAELGLGAAFGAVPGALAAAQTLRGAAETPVRDLPRKVPAAEKLFPDGVATAIVKPNPVKLAEAAAVERAGGTVNVHNVTERPALREIGRAAQHVPFGGGKTEQNRRAITEATVKLLDPDAKDKQLSTEAFNRINDKNGSTIRENMSSVGDVRIDENVSSQLMDLSKRAVDIIDRDQRAYVMKRIADTLDAAEARGGKLSGSELAKWDSAIGEKIRDHHDNSDLTRPLRELQEIVRDAAEKHMPPGKVKETQVARRRYAYGMTLLPDIKKFGATGYIEPGQLWDLVNRDDLGKRRTMSGGSELTDLAKAAKMIEEPEGHGRLTVGTKLGIGTGAGAVAYLNPAAAGAAATAAVGGSRIYNRVGPALVRRLAKEYDKRQARAAQTPEPPPLELAAPDAPTPQGPRPDVRGEAPAEVPEWTTTAGVDAQKPGSQIPAIEPEGLLPAVGDDMPPARINPEPRGRVPDIPAVPGRPDMPDVMVAGGPREVAATETTGRAMQAPEAALAREQQGYAPKKPEPPAGGGGGGGTPPTDPRLAKIAELRRQAPSQAVKKVLDAREAEIKKVIKRETDIAELEAAAQATDDVDLRQSLLAEANKLRGGKLPVGEVTEGMPDLPKPKTEKIPVGKVIEGQPDLPVGKAERIPVGEATEITPEVVEPAPERIPVGEATEMPEPLPVGEVVEDPIPVGDAMEFEQLPAGEATEITPEMIEPARGPVVPEATNVDNAPTAPAGGGRSEGMEQTKGEFTQSLAREPASWVIREKATGKAVMETFDRKKVDALNTEKYEAVPALQHLQELNRTIKENLRTGPQPAPTAPAGGGRSEGMEQTVYFLGSADKHDQVSIYRAVGAFGKEQVWQGPATEAMRKLEELKKTTAQQENPRTDPQPAPTAPAGGGRSEGMEQTKGVAGYSAEKPAWEAVKARTSAAAEALKKYPKLPNGATPDDVKSTAAWRKDYAEYEQAFANERAWNARMLRRYGDEIRAERASEREAKLSAVQQENTRTDPQPAPTAPAGGVEQTKITHAGMEIEEIPGKGGEPTRWQVTVPETGERVQTPSGLDAAKRMAENERKMIERHGTRPEREKAAEAARAAEEQARADTKKARSAETVGKSLAEIKAMDHMNRTIRVDGKDMKAHEFVDARLVAGDVPKVEMVDRVAPMSRRAFNRASGAEQRAHEAKVKAAGKKESYWLGGYGLSKTEYDYAAKKAASKEPAPVPQAPAGGAQPKATPEPVKPAAEGNIEAVRAALEDLKAAGERKRAAVVDSREYADAELDSRRALVKLTEATAQGYPYKEGPEAAARAKTLADAWEHLARGEELVRGRFGAEPVPQAPKPAAPKPAGKTLTPRAPQEVTQQAGVPAEPQGRTGGREAAEAGAGDRVQRAAESGGQAEGAKKEGMKSVALSDSRKATKGALERAGYVVQDLDIGMKLQSRGDLRVSLKAIPHDIDVVISLKNGKWKFSDVSSEAPSSISQAEAVTEFRKLIDGSSVAARPAAEPTKPAPAPRPAPRTEAPATKPAGKALTPAEVKAEFQRQIDAVPRFGDGGPEAITLKAGGSSVKIQNTARRVAEYMKALGTVKGGKTPKPVPKMTHDRPSGRAWWGTDLERRAPLKSITDMIDDFDSQAAVDFAAAQGIDLEEALKGDRKRLDRVRGLKPTPEPQEPPTAGSNFLEEMYGEQPATPAERPKLFGDVDRKRVPVAYRDPNTGGTWSGRGLKPKWLQDALAEGRSLESFEAGKVPAKGQIEGVQLADAHRKSVPFGTVFSYSALGKQKQKLAYELEKLGVPKARAAQIVQDAATMTPGDRGARFLSLAEVRRAAESAGVLFTP